MSLDERQTRQFLDQLKKDLIGFRADFEKIYARLSELEKIGPGVNQVIQINVKLRKEVETLKTQVHALESYLPLLKWLKEKQAVLAQMEEAYLTYEDDPGK